jgi:hypothetical protein
MQIPGYSSQSRSLDLTVQAVVSAQIAVLVAASAGMGKGKMRWSGLMTGLVVGCLMLAQPGSAAAAQVPHSRTYSGRVTRGTGEYARATGNVVVTLTSTQIVQAPDKYAVVITLHGAKCRSTHTLTRQHPVCLALTGTLKGEAEVETEQSNPPASDQPERIRVTASPGRITGLGAVSATGAFEGTGFAPKGHRSLRLSVRAAHGMVFVSAEGPVVPGFTPP